MGESGQSLLQRGDHEEIFRTLFIRNPIGVALLDENGIISDLNDAAVSMSGRSREEIVGKHYSSLDFFKIIGERLSDDVFKKVLTEGSIEPVEVEIKTDKNKVALLKVEMNLISKMGSSKTIQIIARDITERKRWIDSLRESEERFRIIVENSHDGILLVDDNFKFTYVNDQFCRIIGYQRDEIIGHDFREFLDDDAKRLVQERYLRRRKGEKVIPRYEFNAVRKDGEKRRVQLSSSIATDADGKIYTIAQLLDITDSYNATRRLIESEELFRSVFENSPVGIVIGEGKGDDLRIVRANPRFCNMLGYRHEELVGRSVKDLTHPEDFQREEEIGSNLRNGNCNFFSMEKRYLSKDNRIIWGNLTAKLVKDADGSPIFSMGLIEDVTERKLTEIKMEKERNRAELYLDLLGHDIGNLHQGIDLGIQLALSHCDRPERAREALYHSQNLVKRSMKLTRNVLLMSSLKSLETELVQVDVKEKMDAVVANIRETFPRKQIDLNVQAPVGRITITGESIIDEAFFNIMHNAVKFQRGETAKIDISLKYSDRGMLRISVCDRGPGIPDSIKKKVFNRYEDVNSRSLTGIGLHLTKVLVARSNGRIWVEDRVPGDHKKGACVVLELPTLDIDDPE